MQAALSVVPRAIAQLPPGKRYLILFALVVCAMFVCPLIIGLLTEILRTVYEISTADQ